MSAAPELSPSPPAGGDPGAEQRTAMAAERTWLAWWRSALVAVAGALAVGRVTPQVLHAASWPYVALGVGYGALAIGMLVAGAYRQRSLRRAVISPDGGKLDSRIIVVFTVGGVLLTLGTVALVVVQS